jgi:putative ABC transport system permease protein
MPFLSLIIQNLLRRGSRSLLTIVGIALGIAAVVALTSLAWGFERTWNNIYKARGTDLIVTKAKTRSTMPAPFPERIKAELRAMPHVHEVAGVLVQVLGVEESPSMIVAGWETGSTAWKHLKIVRGNWPAADSRNQALVGVVAAESLGKEVGDTLQIETEEFTVCAIVSSSAFAENGAVMLPLTDMQRLTASEGMVNFLDLWLEPNTPPLEVEKLQGAIKEKFTGLSAFSPGDVALSNAGIEIAKAMSIGTSLLALVVGAVGIMNTLLMSVFERVHEIGVLLAIGWKRARILKMILLESVILSLAGGLAGCVLGVLASWVLQSSPWIRGKIESDLSASLLGLALLVAMAVGTFGGLYPAWRASRMSPVNALRQ